MKTILEFRDAHKGKTVLLVGNGENLKKTPPEWFNYPAIGMNTIVKYNGWKPDYFITVDRRVQNEWGVEINEKFKDLPMFLPFPRLKRWAGPNIYYFRAHQGLLWPKNGLNLWQEDFEKRSMIYGNSMHIAIKIAYFMGAKKILIIGMEHEPHEANRHFWGIDKGMSPDTNLDGSWEAGYKILCDALAKRKIKLLNISQDTFVPDNIIPRDNWRNWTEEKTGE